MRLLKAIAGALALLVATCLLLGLVLAAAFVWGPWVLIPGILLPVFSFAVFVFYDIQGQS